MSTSVPLYEDLTFHWFGKENLYKVSRPLRKYSDEQTQKRFVEVIDLLIISLVHFWLSDNLDIRVNKHVC